MTAIPAPFSKATSFEYGEVVLTIDKQPPVRRALLGRDPYVVARELLREAAKESKFGQRLRSKTMTAQINEALCKVLCHNLCVVIQSQHELGIETDFSMAEAA